MSTQTAAVRTGTALREAVVTARRSWTDTGTAGGAAVALAAGAPFVLGGLIADDTLASGAYMALAATGLALLEIYPQ